MNLCMPVLGGHTDILLALNLVGNVHRVAFGQPVPSSGRDLPITASGGEIDGLSTTFFLRDAGEKCKDLSLRRIGLWRVKDTCQPAWRTP